MSPFRLLFCLYSTLFIALRWCLYSYEYVCVCRRCSRRSIQRAATRRSARWWSRFRRAAAQCSRPTGKTWAPSRPKSSRPTAWSTSAGTSEFKSNEMRLFLVLQYSTTVTVMSTATVHSTAVVSPSALTDATPHLLCLNSLFMVMYVYLSRCTFSLLITYLRTA